MAEINVLPGDKEFKDSPDTGWPECICSRCSAKIKEREMPLRMLTERNTEYRYCMKCQKKMGIDYGTSYNADEDTWDDDYDEPYDGPYMVDDDL